MRFVVLGAAGQAREIEYYLRATGHVCLGFVVSDVAKLNANDSRERVLGDMSWIDSNIADVDAFALGIGSPAPRLALSRELKTRHPQIPWPTVIHPTATFDVETTHLGEGVMIGPGVVITVNVALADFCMVNFGATIGHETRVGRGVVINPGANVSGGVEIGDGALVGAGSVILQYRKVGTNAVVGAGAVVTHDVPNSATVVGVPARVTTPF